MSRFVAGQGEEDPPADAEAALPGLFAPSIVHGPHALHPGIHRCFWHLHAALFSGEILALTDANS
jgi:hypothetical protein